MAENSGKQRKPRGRPFVKGQSGNPAGRPKGYEAFRASFREEKDLEKIRKRLLTCLGNTAKDSDAINAARLWYEYGFGKAPSAPDDNEALRATGRLPPGLTADQVLAIARGEKP